MKKIFLLTVVCFSFLLVKGQAVVSDPQNLQFQISRWFEEKKEVIKQSAELVAIGRNIKKGMEIYEQVDAILKQSVYVKDCFKIQMDAADMVIKYISCDPKKLANVNTYKAFGGLIEYNLSQIDELGKLINVILSPATKMTTADRMKELRSINEEMKKKQEEIAKKIAAFEEVNSYEILKNILTKKI